MILQEKEILKAKINQNMVYITELEEIGDISLLETEDKSSIVNAVNELVKTKVNNRKIDELESQIGDISKLPTASNIVDELNEQYGNIKADEMYIETLQTDVSDLETDLTTGIAQLENKVTDNENNITELQTQICDIENEICNKTDITTIITSEETIVVLEMKYNYEVRYGEVSALGITISIEDIDTLPNDFISSVVFTSGETSTNLTYPDFIKMSGEDCIDGIFVPSENERYTIIVSYDGEYVTGIVGGVSI